MYAFKKKVIHLERVNNYIMKLSINAISVYFIEINLNLVHKTVYKTCIYVTFNYLLTHNLLFRIDLSFKSVYGLTDH